MVSGNEKFPEEFEEVRKELVEYMSTENKKTVEIVLAVISGRQEGLFSWFRLLE